MSTARRTAHRALVSLAKGRVRRLRDALDRVSLPPREQALAFQIAMGTQRNELLLDHVLSCFLRRGLPRDPHVRVAARLGAFQLLFLTGIPARAAVFESVGLVHRQRPLLNAVLRRLAERIERRPARAERPLDELGLPGDRTLHLPAPGMPADEDSRLSVRHSLPEFLVRRWRRVHGARVGELCAAASATPAVFLRPNPLWCDRDGLRERLEAEGVDCAPAAGHPDLLRWAGGPVPMRGQAFADGWFVVQDPTSLRAAEAVGASPGETAIDLCAAPGTKATALAAAVRPDGKVFAYDPDERRRPRIEDNARRLRLTEWLTVVADPAELPTADRLLADVPCSNTGVLARRLEVRGRLTEAAIAGLAERQRDILVSAYSRVRAGGTLVYSTCSIEPEENGELVRASLPPNWQIESEKLTLPVIDTCDGGYFAVLRAGRQS